MIPKLPSVIRTTPGKKVASVALLLREAPSGTLDIFFILRQVSKRDIWSGHVAFPGGRSKENETPLEACRREVIEEVGLDVEKSSTLLGQLPSIWPGKLEVVCYVFALNKGYTWDPVLQESEVRACGWAPLSDLLQPRPVPFVVDLAKNPLIQLSSWAPYFGINLVVYTAVFLNIKDRVPQLASPVVVPEKLADSYAESANIIAESGAFMLWGLTLQLCNRFLAQARLGEAVVLRGVFGVPKVFASDIHNFLVVPLGGYTTHTTHWSRLIQLYQNAIRVVVSASVTGGCVFVTSRLARSRM